MPVEIKELVIRAVAQSSDHPVRQTGNEGHHAMTNQSLIEACVKEVLRILKRSEER